MVIAPLFGGAFFRDDMKEIWKPVVGYEGRYEVSNLGRVRSKTRHWQQRSRSGSYYEYRKIGRMLKPGVSSNGYPTVTLGRRNSKTVHSLVAAAFIGPCPREQEVRHKNGVRSDPRVANLEYGTRTENIKDAIKHGTWMTPARLAHMRRIGFGARRALAS